jgi:hypothetical protein
MCAESQTRFHLEGVFHRANNAFSSLQHCPDPIPQSVIVGARWRNLVHGYINGNVRICLHFHSFSESDELEGRDLVFAFQKSSAIDANVRESSAFRAANLRTRIGSPGTEHVKPSMPILASPIVQDFESPVEVENHIFRREFRNIIRLYSFENGSSLVREWRSIEGVVVSTAFADREFELVFIGGRVLSSLADTGTVDTRIKSGSQLVEHFAKLERNSVKELPSVDWVDPDAPCPIVIHAYAGGVEAFFRNVIVPHLGDGFAVTLCTSDTLPTPFKLKKRHGTEDYIRVG